MNTQPQRDIEAGPDYQGGEPGMQPVDTLDPTIKRPRTAWKGEYEKAITRYHSMKFTASVGYIIAGLEALAIVILILK